MPRLQRFHNLSSLGIPIQRTISIGNFILLVLNLQILFQLYHILPIPLKDICYFEEIFCYLEINSINIDAKQ